MSTKPITGLSAPPNVKENQLNERPHKTLKPLTCVCSTVDCYLLVRRPMTAVERYELVADPRGPYVTDQIKPEQTR